MLTPAQNHTIINIAGCCISRDIFGMHTNDGGYQIRHYASAFSPLHVFDKKCIFSEEEFKSVDTAFLASNFFKTRLFQELTRTSLKFLHEEQADYLIVDTGLLHLRHYELENGCIVCCDKKNLIEFFIKKKIIPPIKRELGFDHLSEEEVVQRTKEYGDILLKHYPPEKIILIEVKYAESYYDESDCSLYNFIGEKDAHIKRNLISLVFRELKNHIPAAHIVPMPDSMFAVSHHKWGKYPLHYVPEYYDYALEAVAVITLGLPRKEELKKLEDLRQKYSLQCSTSYGRCASYLTPPYSSSASLLEKLFHYFKFWTFRTLSHICFGHYRSIFKQKYRQYQSMFVKN